MRSAPTLLKLLSVLLALAFVAVTVSDADAKRKRRKKKRKKPVVEKVLPGKVFILSTTDGATVEIDGKLVGTVPIDDAIELEPGPHTIVVKKPGWTEISETFNVAAGSEEDLEFDLIPSHGFLKLSTDRPGASVKVGDRVVGVTPYDADVPVGKITVLVTRPGFKDHTELLDVIPGQRYTVDVQLIPLEKPSESVVGKWWFWTAIGVAVAGGATAAVLLSQDGETTTLQPHFRVQLD